jgi:membrane-bound metal-dependent hydrolase YbcI (DUF457 family)
VKAWTRAAGCLGAIAVADVVLHRRRLPWLAIGLFDHPAHLATAGLVALNVRDRPARWTQGLLVGSLLPDLDHVPLALGEWPKDGDPRPVTHCLAAIAPVAAAAALTQSERLHGTATGMLAHFARDVGVGTGVPLLWPLSRRSVRVRYGVYAGGCVGLAVLALASAYSRSRPWQSRAGT